MSVDANDCPRFAWIVLMFFGFFNLTRGFMHTVLVEYAAANIAGLDLSVVRADQLVLLMNYGYSNFMTGAVFILIALKARNLVPPAILLVSVFSVISPVTIELMGPTADFAGRLLAPVWLAIGLITLIGIYMHRRRAQ
jgi:hypothetical protein